MDCANSFYILSLYTCIACLLKTFCKCKSLGQSAQRLNDIKRHQTMQSSTDTSPKFGGDTPLDLVVSHLVQPTIVSMQSSIDNPLFFLGDTPLDLVVSHSIQPMVEEVVVSMQYSIDSTLLLESDKNTSHVSFVSFDFLGHGGIHSMVPLPIPEVCSFNWNSLEKPHLPSYVSFHIVVEGIYSTIH